MKRALFDTNIIVDALNGLKLASTEYDIYDEVIISRISYIETLCGSDDEMTRSFLKNNFTIAPLDDEVSHEAVSVRRELRLKLPDAIILATARVYKCKLITRNTKEMKSSWPEVRIPYRL